MKHLLLAVLLLSFFASSGQGSLESDRLALIALYNSTNGPGWLQKAGWNPAGNPGDSPCGWYGVTCEGGRVTGLNLTGSAIDGSLPPEIGNLDQLKTSLSTGLRSLTGKLQILRATCLFRRKSAILQTWNTWISAV